MFHLACFSGSLAAGPLPVPAIPDPALTLIPTGNQYQFPLPFRLKAAYALGGLLAAASIQSPTLKIVNIPYIRPINPNSQPTSRDQVMWLQDQQPILPALEAIAPVVTNSGAGPTTTTVGLWLGISEETVPPGQIITMRGTAAGTAIAGAWTLMPFAFDQQLPSGTYMIVGAEVISTTIVFFRFAFPNAQWRPGGLGHNAVGDIQDPKLQNRGLGGYYSFMNTAPPLLEVFCNAADTAFELYLQVVPISIPGFQGQTMYAPR